LVGTTSHFTRRDLIDPLALYVFIWHQRYQFLDTHTSLKWPQFFLCLDFNWKWQVFFLCDRLKEFKFFQFAQQCESWKPCNHSFQWNEPECKKWMQLWESKGKWTKQLPGHHRRWLLVCKVLIRKRLTFAIVCIVFHAFWMLIKSLSCRMCIGDSFTSICLSVARTIKE